MDYYDLFLKLASEYSSKIGRKACERIAEKLKEFSSKRFESLAESKVEFDQIFAEEGLLWDNNKDRSKLYFRDQDNWQLKEVKDVEITHLKINREDGIRIDVGIKYTGREPKKIWYGGGRYTQDPDKEE